MEKALKSLRGIVFFFKLQKTRRYRSVAEAKPDLMGLRNHLGADRRCVYVGRRFSHLKSDFGHSIWLAYCSFIDCLRAILTGPVD